TETDNVLFCALTHNLARLHLDAEYAKETMFGERLMNSMFILSLICGIIVPETTLGTTVANLGFQEISFPRPVFAGDTIHVQTKVLERRESKSHPEAGIVYFNHRGLNQHDEIICDCKRAGMMLKRPTSERDVDDGEGRGRRSGRK
ncbi:MAG: MaoC family dehydratase, partial [Thermomicrobium sp.]|nr:MaoC family dehydratase [Thermomicrobium sp.]